MANVATSMYFYGVTNDPDYLEYSEARGHADDTGPSSMRFYRNPWTVEIWAYMVALSTDGRSTLIQLDGVDSEYLMVGVDTNGTSVTLKASDNASLLAAVTTAAFPSSGLLGNWHHIACVRNGSLFTVFHNGQ